MADTILITGANRGIGLEMAKAFGEQGWNVLACCREPGQADELNRLGEHHPGCEVHRLDVTDGAAIERLARELNTRPIDILFNNAGIFGPEKQGFGETDPAAWLEVMKTNVVAPMKMAEAFVDHVAGSGRRVIASMGSMMGCIGDNSSGGHYIYRTSKAAVHMVAKGLSVDLRDRGIISVVFHPGWVRTRMGGPRAPTSPEESARGLCRVLTSIGPDQNGLLLTFEGKKLNW